MRETTSNVGGSAHNAQDRAIGPRRAFVSRDSRVPYTTTVCFRSRLSRRYNLYYGTNGENRLARVARRVKPQLRVGDADDEGAAAGLLDGAQARECRGDRRRLARASEGVRASEGSEGVRVVAVRVRVRVRSRARARARVGRHAWSSPLRKMAHGGHVRHAGPVQELAPLLAPDGHEGLGHDDQHPACLRSRRAWRGVERGGEGGGSRESRLEVGAKCELG